MADTQISKLLDISDRIASGQIPEYQHSECYTSGAFDLLIIHARGAKAFDLLSEACKLYREIKSTRPSLKGYFSLLSALAVNSETTELPIGLLDIIKKNPELSLDLRRWYRVPS